MLCVWEGGGNLIRPAPRNSGGAMRRQWGRYEVSPLLPALPPPTSLPYPYIASGPQLLPPSPIHPFPCTCCFCPLQPWVPTHPFPISTLQSLYLHFPLTLTFVTAPAGFILLQPGAQSMAPSQPCSNDVEQALLVQDWTEVMLWAPGFSKEVLLALEQR